MANDKSKVTTGKPLATGGVLVAPRGTALPAKGTAPTGDVVLDKAFIAIGYVDSDDGYKQSEDNSTTDITAWGGDTVLTVVTTHKETHSFTPIEQNINVWRLRYGTANVTGADGAAVVRHNRSAFDEHWSVIVAEQLADGRVCLHVVPDAKLDEVDDEEHSDDAASRYPMTFVGLPDEDGDTSYDVYYTPTSSKGE